MRDVCVSLVIPILMAASARGLADDAAAPAPAGELVRKLGDASFRVRESAEGELLRRGAAALADVTRGAQDADLEIRRRCQSILLEIQRSEDDAVLGPFLAGKAAPKGSLPGWNAIKSFMEDDADSRYLYALLYKSERPMLDVLEKDPQAAGEQFGGRFQKMQPALNGARDKNRITVDDIAALVLIVALEQTKVEANATERLFGILGHPRIQECVQWSHATRRLIERSLEKKCDDPAVGFHIYQLAVVYNCNDLMTTRLRPATVKAVDAACANPLDFNLFYKALNQARQCNMVDLIDFRLKPAVVRGLETTARAPVDFNRLNQLVNCAQQIGGMGDELKPVLRPVVIQFVEKQIENLNDSTRFYTIIQLARLSKNDDILEESLRPAVRVALVQTAFQAKEFTQLTTAYHKAQQLNMHEEVESILKPAAEIMVQSLLAKNDTGDLQRALTLAQTFAFRETLRPVAQRFIDDVAQKTPEIDRLFLIVQLARTAALPDVEQVIEKQLKSAARMALLAAADKPVELATIAQALGFADQLQLKEGVPLALKALQSKKLPAYIQSQAIFHVALRGNRDAMPALEPLLKDATSIGTVGINGVTIQAQIGDVALAALIHLSGQKFEDYDFPWARIINQGPNQVLHPSYHCYGFETDAARQVAQKKWRDSQAPSKKSR
jgi:hypothetical protein